MDEMVQLPIIEKYLSALASVNWEGIRIGLGILGDVCLFFIAVYTFRLTIYPKKLRFISFNWGTSTFDGDRFQITLENRSLCPVIVESVDLEIDSYRVKVFRGECTVDAFKVAQIVMEPYSEIAIESGVLDVSSSLLGNMSLWVKTSRGLQHIKYKRESKLFLWLLKKQYSEYKPSTVCRQHYNGKLVASGVKYALSFVDGNGELQTVFIHKSGTMNTELFGGNRLPDCIMQDEKTIRDFFDERFSSAGMIYSFKRVDGMTDDSHAYVEETDPEILEDNQ